MKFKPKHIITKCFPAKQLLIRQDGEIKVVELSTAKQCTRAFAAISCALALGAGATYSWLQTKEHSLDWQQVQQENDTLRERLTAATSTKNKVLDQLAALEQRQSMTESVLASLPASLLPEQGIAFELTPEADIDTRVAQLESNQTNTFYLLDDIIAKRELALSEALAQAGLPQTVMDQLLAQSEEHVAQGGPLELVDEHYLDEQSLSVVDRLLTLNQLETLLGQVPQMLPAADYYISSNFGLRKDPMNGRRAFHKGVDLAAWRNTEIFAPADGTVVRAGNNGGYGRFIEIEHANGFTTRFGHLNKINVKRGDSVQKGDVIALMGSTGRSTATHLHYEVLHNNKHINPVKITKALNDIFQQQSYTEE